MKKASMASHFASLQTLDFEAVCRRRFDWIERETLTGNSDGNSKKKPDKIGCLVVFRLAWVGPTPGRVARLL